MAEGRLVALGDRPVDMRQRTLGDLGAEVLEYLFPDTASLLRGEPNPRRMEQEFTPLPDVGKVIPTNPGDPRMITGAGEIAGAIPFGGPGAAAIIAGPMAKGALRGIRAYHGSPHKFDKFDISKIGTGEGAQSYGHGLYFAENEGVARIYRDNLSKPNLTHTGSGAPISPGLSRLLEDGYTDAMGQGVRGPSGRDAMHMAEQSLHRQRADALKSKDFDWYSRVADQQAELARIMKDPPKFSGHMYEVNIRANPEQFLDWDRPLSGQPARSAIEDSFVYPFKPQDTGRDLYDSFVSYRYGSPGVTRESAKVDISNRLREAGIPGIKYLDQGSRGLAPNQLARIEKLENDAAHIRGMIERPPSHLRGQDMSHLPKQLADTEKALADVRTGANMTSNYVLFDDSIIDILKRYGIIGAAGGGAGAAALTADQQL